MNNKGNTRYLILVTLLCAFCVSGCGAILKGTTQTISIKSAPEGSTIEVNGQEFTSPALIELPRNRNYIVTISKEGYETHQSQIHKTISGGILIIDILLGLMPVIVDAAMGTWYNLSPGEIMVTLKSKQDSSLDIPIKITANGGASVTVESPQSIQVKIESE